MPTHIFGLHPYNMLNIHPKPFYTEVPVSMFLHAKRIEKINQNLALHIQCPFFQITIQIFVNYIINFQKTFDITILNNYIKETYSKTAIFNHYERNSRVIM